MADATGPDLENVDTPPIGHVLHVADARVTVRCGPMLAQIWSGLAAAGVRTSLLTNDGDAIARLEGLPIECGWVPHVGGWRGWGLGSQLTARFRPPPDLVHLWGTPGLWWVQRWASKAGVALVVHALGAAHVDRLMRSGLGHDQHAVLASERLTASLLTRFPLVASRCWTIPLVVAPPVRPAGDRSAERTLGVVAVCSAEGSGGVELLIDAVGQLRRSQCDVQAVVISDGLETRSLWQRIREREAQACVSLINEPGLWEKALHGADVCVVAAEQRELWLAPLLAMGMGKVVIASRDQPAEWFVEDRTAWQFTPGSAAELAYLLARAAEQPKLAGELGEKAAEYVRRHHAVGEAVARLLGVYRAVRHTGKHELRGSTEAGDGSNR